MLKTKFFRKIEKVIMFQRKRSFFIQNTEDFLAQLDKQFGKAEEAFAKLSQEIKRLHRNNYS
jgi:hypothetical protein